MGVVEFDLVVVDSVFARARFAEIGRDVARPPYGDHLRSAIQEVGRMDPEHGEILPMRAAVRRIHIIRVFRYRQTVVMRMLPQFVLLGASERPERVQLRRAPLRPHIIDASDESPPEVRKIEARDAVPSIAAPDRGEEIREVRRGPRAPVAGEVARGDLHRCPGQDHAGRQR